MDVKTPYCSACSAVASVLRGSRPQELALLSAARRSERCRENISAVMSNAHTRVAVFVSVDAFVAVAAVVVFDNYHPFLHDQMLVYQYHQ